MLIRTRIGLCPACVALFCCAALAQPSSPGTPAKDASTGSNEAKSAQPSKESESKASATKDALRSQAERIWKARVDRNCAIVVKYLDPAEYGTFSEEERKAVCDDDPFRYEKFHIGQIEVEGRYGWVPLTYLTKMAKYENQPAQEIDTIEKWRFTDGEWYPVASRIAETCPEPPSTRDLVQEKRLRERFDLTWKLRLAKNWKELYQTTDPQDRARVDEATYADSEGLLEYYEREVDWVQVIGTRGEVRVTYDHKLNDPNMTKLARRKINLSEHWIKRNDEWYRELVRGN